MATKTTEGTTKLMAQYTKGGRVMVINCKEAKYHGYVIMGFPDIVDEHIITAVGRHIVPLSNVLLILESNIHQYVEDLKELSGLRQETKDTMIEKLILLYSEMK